MITNRHNLPEEVYKALCSNRYNSDDDGKKTDYSATTIIAPIQQTILKKRYPDCNDEDACDRIWAMFGSIAHSLLEEHGSDDSLTENRFYYEYLGKSISGQVDHYKDSCITDYKTTSAYKITKGSYDEWEKQLNIYAFLARQNGYPVRNLRIIAIIRDWSETEAVKPNYPKTPIVEIPITLWIEEEQEEFIQERIQELIEAEDRKDFNLPMCTQTDMWQDNPSYAVMKEGGARAVKVCQTEDEVYNYLKERSIIDDEGNPIAPYYVQKREGVRRRCARYCSVSSKCCQWNTYLKAIEEEANV